jgi:dTDP-4-amino-4,6-dideoxygalactose transaminase
MTEEGIAFHRAFVTGRELELVGDAIARREFSGDGYYTKQAAGLLETLVSADGPLLTTSCTHALELCALLLDLEPGDEVIMPSFTFVSTANAFALRGAVPVFADIRPDTWNIDESRIEELIGPRTRAIVVVHYAGIACEMDEICAIAERHGLVVVEDAAHALGATYRGRSLGTLGALGTFSFHATKNVQCGEGGALVVGDEELRQRAEILREKGTNRARFLRGMIDKYTWVDVGSSYLMGELLAAFLFAQLEAFELIQRRRHGIYDLYVEALTPWAKENGIVLPANPDDRAHPAHLFAMVLPSAEVRDEFIHHMGEHGIKTTFHYVPLHSAPVGRGFSKDVELPVTDRVGAGLVRLPLYPDLTEGAATRVVERASTFTVPS